MDIRILPSTGDIQITGSANFLGDNSNSILYLTGSSGNIGVNTTNPQATLHASGSSDVFIVEGSGSAANNTIMAVDGNSGRLFEVSDDLTDSLFSINTISGIPVFEAFATNDVNIGKYPDYPLYVTGSGAQTIATGSFTGSFVGDGSGLTSVDAETLDGQNGTYYLNYNNFSNTPSSASINYWTQSGSDLYYNSGNVGIGTTSPDNARLHISGGNVNLDNDTYLAWGGGNGRPAIGGNKTTGNVFFVSSDVGIGTTSPSTALDVVGTITTNNHGDSSEWNEAYDDSVTGFTRIVGDPGRLSINRRGSSNLSGTLKSIATADARSTSDFINSDGSNSYMPEPDDAQLGKGFTPIFSLDWPGSSWGSMLTIKGWNTGYAAWQMAGSSATTATNEWYLRTGNGTSWNTWAEIWTDINLTNVSQLTNDSGYITGYTVTQSDVTQYESNLSIGWSQLTSVPSTFTPENHNHDASDITSGTLSYSRLPISSTEVSDWNNHLSLTNNPHSVTKSQVGLGNVINEDFNDYGLGSNGVGYAPNDDWNDLTKTGFYKSHTSTLNSPFNSFGLGIHIAYSTTNSVQIIGSRNGNSSLYHRGQSNGSYGSWHKIWDDNNLTNVSQLNNDSGYITSYTVTQGDVTQHEGALTITESQISDLSHVTNNNQLTNGAGYITSYTVTNSDLSGLNISQLTNDSGYITGYSVTQSDVTQHEAALSIGWSQLTGVPSYDNYNGWDLIVDGTDRGVITSSEPVEFKGGTHISLTYAATNNAITIDADNYYLENLSFDTGDGTLYANVDGTTDQTVNLDGRYALQSHNHTWSDLSDISALKSDINSINQNLSTTSNVTFDSVDLVNHEASDFTTSGRLFYDASAGAYIISSNASHSNPALLWSSANFTAGLGLSVSYGSEDEPSLSISSNVIRGSGDPDTIPYMSSNNEISSSGMNWDSANSRLGINTIPTYPLDVNGNNGGISIRATNDIVAYSDRRVKNNINTIEDALDKVMSIRGVTYNRIDSDTTHTSMGFIAQEIQSSLPEVVREDENGYLSVAYGNTTAILTEAIKEQQAQINENKKEIAELKEMVNKLISK